MVSKKVLLLLAAATPITADTTFDHNEKHAWGANTGWVSFRHDQPTSPAGVVFGGAFLSGFAWAANLGWIHFGDGSPANGHSYSNTGDDHGVNHDGAGNLTGYAWSANTGWIHFGWATPTNSDRARVNLITGAFAGYAWGANAGWVNLGTGILTTQSMSDEDTDNDGIADWWEKKHFEILTTANQTSDTDGDGRTDAAEYLSDTDPEDSGSYFRIVAQSHNPGLAESMLAFTSTPTRLYRIEYANDLSSPWTNSGLGIFAPDAGATTTRTITYPGHPEKFFRAVALRPLP